MARAMGQTLLMERLSMLQTTIQSRLEIPAEQIELNKYGHRLRK